MNQTDKRRLNWILWLHVGVGIGISFALVVLQELTNFQIFSEGATVFGVMTAVMGNATRTAYKAGQESRTDELKTDEEGEHLGS